MPLGDRVGGGVASELLGGELADGLQQPEASAEPVGFDGDHRSLDEVLQQVVDVSRVQLVVTGHVFGGGEVEWAGEDREPLEECLLALSQQIVGPGDGRPEGPVPLGGGPTAAGQESEAVAESFHEIRWGERPGARGGQLDGEGKPVDASADLLDLPSVHVRVERR